MIIRIGLRKCLVHYLQLCSTKIATKQKKEVIVWVMRVLTAKYRLQIASQQFQFQHFSSIEAESSF